MAHVRLCGVRSSQDYGTAQRDIAFQAQFGTRDGKIIVRCVLHRTCMGLALPLWFP